MSRFFGTDSPIQPTGEWLRISSEMTYAADEMTGRDDMLVKVSPDAGYDEQDYDDNGKPKKGAVKHPGVTYLERGIIEIDGNLLPGKVRLKDVHPLRRNDPQKYPVLWGVLAHEAGHSRHSKWLIEVKRRDQAGALSADERNWAGAALIIEEPRVEHGQLQFRPQDQLWLQASGTEISLKELSGLLTDGKLDGKTALARASAFIHGRIDAGSIDPTPVTARLEQVARDTFGRDYDRLREIWMEAMDVADDDHDAMLRLGKRWFELTGDNGGDRQENQGGQRSGLQQAVSQAIDALSQIAKEAREEATGEGQERRRQEKLGKAVRERDKENGRRKNAREEARKVFSANPDPNSKAGLRHPVTGYRDATDKEMSLARLTRHALQAAYTPERAVVKTYTALPPGKLVTSRAMQVSAQRSMGLPVTVNPVRSKERRRTAVPPLKVAIIQDVSGSQQAAASAAVSGAWSLAKATEGIMDAQVAMVTFGDAVHAIIGPRDKVPRVPVLHTPSGSHHLHEALGAIEGEMDLTRKGFARLLVILTDGVHEKQQIDTRREDLTRLRDAGVKILWFVTDGASWRSHTPDIRGVRVFHEGAGKYEVIPKMICTEAVNALKS